MLTLQRNGWRRLYDAPPFLQPETRDARLGFCAPAFDGRNSRIYKGVFRFVQHLRERDARRKQRRQSEGRGSQPREDSLSSVRRHARTQNTRDSSAHTQDTGRLLSEPEVFRIASVERASWGPRRVESPRKGVYRVPEWASFARQESLTVVRCLDAAPDRVPAAAEVDVSSSGFTHRA